MRTASVLRTLNLMYLFVAMPMNTHACSKSNERDRSRNNFFSALS